jgi:hypothetical protein
LDVVVASYSIQLTFPTQSDMSEELSELQQLISQDPHAKELWLFQQDLLAKLTNIKYHLSLDVNTWKAENEILREGFEAVQQELFLKTQRVEELEQRIQVRTISNCFMKPITM